MRRFDESVSTTRSLSLPLSEKGKERQAGIRQHCLGSSSRFTFINLVPFDLHCDARDFMRNQKQRQRNERLAERRCERETWTRKSRENLNELPLPLPLLCLPLPGMARHDKVHAVLFLPHSNLRSHLRLCVRYALQQRSMSTASHACLFLGTRHANAVPCCNAMLRLPASTAAAAATAAAATRRGRRAKSISDVEQLFAVSPSLSLCHHCLHCLLLSSCLVS